eukprot:364640-Chlamydomonas_euryale.AAC.4
MGGWGSHQASQDLAEPRLAGCMGSALRAAWQRLQAAAARPLLPPLHAAFIAIPLYSCLPVLAG